ncbi:MAG: NADH:ubiquinone reductase (Na(+)-transporting) subunit B [Myxococcota bacterium]
MKFLLETTERIARRFQKGQPLEKLYPAFEAGDTFLFTPGSVTQADAHVRDGIDLKRVMITVVYALIPAILMAMYNTGLQIHRTVEQGGSLLENWQSTVYQWLALPVASDSILGCFVHGALYFLPVLIVTFAVGGLLEVGFCVIRGHEVSEGLLVTGMLIPLTMPATVPYWQLALGVAFGVGIGKEIFGGTGMNFLNPALTARAFLFFAYPGQLSGEVWVAAKVPDGTSGATWLASYAEGSGHLAGFTFWDAFLGTIPGSMGETSTLACLIGAAFLLWTRIASWETMVGVVAGTATMALTLNGLGSTTTPMVNMPWYYHFVVGGWAFGTVFMATDPVSSACTSKGKLAYGALIGVLAVLIRCINPAYPEGIMLAILFMNMFAPLIDHYVIEANKRRRAARYARA